MTELLLIATLVLGAGVGVPFAFPRWPIWLRVFWRVTTLVLLTLLVQRIVGSPLQPVFRGEATWDRLWQQLVTAGWWIVAARSVAGVARLLLSFQNRSRETQILSDLIGAGMYAATALAIVDVVFAVPIGGLIATSGIIAVVIGLALQSTLADVFSGIAIDIERPYRAGDLLWIEGGVEGRVREVNWRSTLVVTGNGDVAVVPNSVMAKSRLVNHSLPAPIRRASVEVRLDPRAPPERCQATLEAAVRACLLPLPSPTPAVNLTALNGDGAIYEIAFSVPSSENLGAARSELLAQVQRHLLHAAIPMAVAGITELPPLAVPSAADLLARSDLFGCLTDEERDLLARGMDEVGFEDGATLFKQDDMVDALYVVSAGTVGILRRQPDGSEVVRRMSPGSCLGIIGLVTGLPFAATATALTPVRAFRLEKTALVQALASRPELMTSLEGLARRSQAAIRQDAAAEEEHHVQRSEILIARMRAFLRLIASQGAEDKIGQSRA